MNGYQSSYVEERVLMPFNSKSPPESMLSRYMYGRVSSSSLPLSSSPTPFHVSPLSHV